ncbi:4'-phosphopantetheinyl transferase family protein [Psychrobacter okhotskensis]|uniref:4'-phosphopantetheinyl transferase family protein n=1 Tax=Psychrobacter okhotskensis TaxID=212403 RepID=UPI00191A4FB6|nr:4'-phosphopantetheinyl transferase superfamily protein [Psychrobacter okhotskensis]
MMQKLQLIDVKYTQLDPMTWCATAEVSEPLSLYLRETKRKSACLSVFNIPDMNLHQLHNANGQHYASQSHLSARDIAYNQRQQQRKGVRLLLKALLNKLEITDTLDESDFPYRLMNSKYYVCFSHTGAGHKNDRHTDSDTDFRHANHKSSNNKIAVAISRRHAVGIDIETNEVARNVAQRFYHPYEIAALQALSASNRSTMTKLFWQIKESFIKIHQYKLAQGLGMDYSYLLPSLVDKMSEKSPVIIINDDKIDYHIAVLLSQQTVVVF